MICLCARFGTSVSGGPPQEPSLSKAELAAVFEGPFDAQTAELLAACLTDTIGKDELMATDLVEPPPTTATQFRHIALFYHALVPLQSDQARKIVVRIGLRFQIAWFSEFLAS